jgi:hypothetical protein
VMQIRKGSPNSKESKHIEQDAALRSSVLPSGLKNNNKAKPPNSMKKGSMTTHATASCVFGVVGPLNQLGASG